jgi:hypothetical protein
MPKDGAAVSRNVADSNKCLDKLRHSCSTTEHLAACIFSNKTTRGLFHGIAMIAQPTRKQHGLAMAASRSPGLGAAFRIESASGWQQEIVDILLVSSNRDELVRARFLTPEWALRATVAQRENDDFVARCIYRFMVEHIGHRIAFSSCLSSLPWAAAALVDPNPENVQRMLQRMKLWFESLIRLCSEARHDPNALTFKMRLVWPEWDWSHALLIELSEFDFAVVRLTPHFEISRRFHRPPTYMFIPM